MQCPKKDFTDRFLASLKAAAKRFDVIDATRRGPYGPRCLPE